MTLLHRVHVTDAQAAVSLTATCDKCGSSSWQAAIIKASSLIIFGSSRTRAARERQHAAARAASLAAEARRHLALRRPRGRVNPQAKRSECAPRQ